MVSCSAEGAAADSAAAAMRRAVHWRRARALAAIAAAAERVVGLGEEGEGEGERVMREGKRETKKKNEG